MKKNYKYLIFSDLHGNIQSTNDIINIFLKGNFDKMICLGDVLYHGPRNKISKDYNPLEVAKILNKYKDKFIYIKGNCDARIDETLIGVKAKNYVYLKMSLFKKILFTHGDLLKEKDFNGKAFISAIIYGHTHVFNYYKVKNTKYINLNSISIPKDGIKSFLILEKNNIKRFDLNKNLLFEINF